MSSTPIDSIAIPIVFWSFISSRLFTVFEFVYVGVEVLICRRTLGVGVEWMESDDWKMTDGLER